MKSLNIFLLGSLLIAFVVAQQNVCTGNELSFEADLTSQGTEWNHFWERCVGSGHALLGLRQVRFLFVFIIYDRVFHSFSNLLTKLQLRLERTIGVRS